MASGDIALSVMATIMYAMMRKMREMLRVLGMFFTNEFMVSPVVKI